MYIPLVLEYVQHAVDEYLCQFIAFRTDNFSADVYGMFLAVYFQGSVIDA